jgi:tRNA pseudouridine38-40 synthase
MRFKLTIEYAGTRYSGWQIQKNAKTVQGEIERAITAATGERDFELYGSGRTDAGVHALAQVAHLDIHITIPPETLRRRINDELPADINILDVEKVRHKFHARHDAIGRTYIYQVSRRRTAFAKPYVWWVKEELDLTRMQTAAARFVGFHDFKSFSDADPREGSTEVMLEALDIRGLTPDEAAGLLSSDSGVPARLTAPASGLFLASVRYKGDRPDQGRLLRGGVTPFNRR